MAKRKRPDGSWYRITGDRNQNARNYARGYRFSGPGDLPLAIEMPRDDNWYLAFPETGLSQYTNWRAEETSERPVTTGTASQLSGLNFQATESDPLRQEAYRRLVERHGERKTKSAKTTTLWESILQGMLDEMAQEGETTSPKDCRGAIDTEPAGPSIPTPSFVPGAVNTEPAGPPIQPNADSHLIEPANKDEMLSGVAPEADPMDITPGLATTFVVPRELWQQHLLSVIATLQSDKLYKIDSEDYFYNELFLSYHGRMNPWCEQKRWEHIVEADRRMDQLHKEFMDSLDRGEELNPTPEQQDLYTRLDGILKYWRHNLCGEYDEHQTHSLKDTDSKSDASYQFLAQLVAIVEKVDDQIDQRWKAFEKNASTVIIQVLRKAEKFYPGTNDPDKLAYYKLLMKQLSGLLNGMEPMLMCALQYARSAVIRAADDMSASIRKAQTEADLQVIWDGRPQIALEIIAMMEKLLASHLIDTIQLVFGFLGLLDVTNLWEFHQFWYVEFAKLQRLFEVRTPPAQTVFPSWESFSKYATAFLERWCGKGVPIPLWEQAKRDAEYGLLDEEEDENSRDVRVELLVLSRGLWRPQAVRFPSQVLL